MEELLLVADGATDGLLDELAERVGGGDATALNTGENCARGVGRAVAEGTGRDSSLTEVVDALVGEFTLVWSLFLFDLLVDLW